MFTDTIAAIATPVGEGAISIIRISGPNAYEIANKIFSGNVLSYTSHTAHLGKILAEDGAIIDEVLLLVMEKGRSFTGERSVEIMCHGGSFITQKVLARVLEAGAKAAGPGEFSLRAFRNGNVDLAQAEAIASLIAAKNDAAIQAAGKQLSGELSIRIKDLQQSIADIAAIIEAWVDYPEEGIEYATTQEMKEMLESVLEKIETLRGSFHEGKLIADGISLCLLGAPNVGKSSLMNALLRDDRAIVTEIAGTTRDVLQEEMRLGDLSFRVIDTAGVRETDEVIEQEGIRRTMLAANEADLIVILLDASREITDEENQLMEKHPEALIVHNKMDMAKAKPTGICISAKHKTGLDDLKSEIEKQVFSGIVKHSDVPLITKERHFLALQEAKKSVQAVYQGLDGELSPEFLAFDLRSALKELATIIGTNVTEDILGAIFSKFCVGK